MDGRPPDVLVHDPLGKEPVDRVGERARGLDPGRAGAHDHEVQGAAIDEARIAVRRLEHGEQPRAQPLGIVDRVERERVLVGARGMEEVGYRAEGQHQVVAAEGDPVGAGHGPGRRIDGRHVRHRHLHAVTLGEHRSQRPRDIRGLHLCRCHLVEQRLELVVVVTVDQPDGHAVLRQPLGARDAGESGAHDDRRSFTRWRRHRDVARPAPGSMRRCLVDPTRGVERPRRTVGSWAPTARRRWAPARRSADRRRSRSSSRLDRS